MLFLFPQKMFAAEAKAFVQTLGGTDLISNDNLNCKMDLLTLVKVTEGIFWPVQKYKVIHCSLPELTEEENFSPGTLSRNKALLSNHGSMKEGQQVHLVSCLGDSLKFTLHCPWYWEQEGKVPV